MNETEQSATSSIGDVQSAETVQIQTPPRASSRSLAIIEMKDYFVSVYTLIFRKILQSVPLGCLQINKIIQIADPCCVNDNLPCLWHVVCAHCQQIK